MLARDLDQRRTDIDADDFVELPGERLRMAARATAGIQGPASVRRHAGEQPVQDTRLLETRKAIIVRSKPVE